MAPMELKNSFIAPLSDEEKLKLFECRVEVWMLGAAVEMLKQIEHAKRGVGMAAPAYGLLTVTFTYFEMIGKTLNQASRPRGTAGGHFNYGFCDVYPAFAAQWNLFG